ncbi:MAG: DUF5694 domain-containing protein [Bacillota bacterium]|nr:DUF5694 domain-containing protein [Bacillota bacterium]
MKEKAKVLILGTYHFGKGGKHLIDMDAEDITSDKKQQEISEVIQKLIQFKPNKIAVEAKRDKEYELNEAYLQYCINNFKESNGVISQGNEIVQLGFRLGQALNHDKIYPIDKPVDLPDQVFEYAEKNCPNIYEKYMNEVEEYGRNENEYRKSHTVLEILKHLNDPKRIKNEHSNLYLYLAQVGAGDKYCGAEMLTEWYKRNLYIFGNLQAISEPEDRILVIYGAGHCSILRSFVKDYNEFDFVDPLDNL